MKNILVYLTFVSILSSCASSLNHIETEELINNYYSSLSNQDRSYQVEQMPVKRLQKYGSKKDALEYFEKKYPFEKNKDSKQYTNISNLLLSELQRCGSTKYYVVDFDIRSGEFAPYFNKESENYVKKEYGEDGYYYNPNTKILEITETIRMAIIRDTDHKWKVQRFDPESIESGYGRSISKCIVK